MSTTRRTLLACGAAAAAAVLTRRKGFALQSEERRIALHAGIETGLIRPELHGHFAEHLGTCTYGGLWVGPNSSVPNINGYRKKAVEYLRALGIPVLRWPGGCFADDYHWRDGIGPVAKRPRTVNIHWGNYTEDNSFGTHEFIGLCRLIGAEPYLAGNVGSGTPQELRDWVEYCNYPAGSTLSDERIANGAREPFKIRYWGVGNENWGCGGRMTPDEYAGHYRRFSGYMRPFGDLRPYLIACGPSSNDIDWTRRFFDGMRGRYQTIQGYTMHFYSRGRDGATGFSADHVDEQLSSFDRMEKAILQQAALMEGYDPERKIGLLIDEWGVWDKIDPEEEKRFGRLWQQITMRSAVAAALGLNVFHRQSARLVMCNIAQIANVLHSVILTHEDRTIRTTTYYAFELLKPHRGGNSIRVENPGASPLGLSVSASRAERELYVTCVNPKHDAGVRVNCAVDGALASSASATILQDGDFNACNTFETPDRVTPKSHPVELERGSLRLTLPPLAIATVKVQLS